MSPYLRQPLARSHVPAGTTGHSVAFFAFFAFFLFFAGVSSSTGARGAQRQPSNQRADESGSTQSRANVTSRPACRRELLST
jgi:hypothetical protein